MFNLPEDPIHLGVLIKFEHLKGTVFHGQTEIKGKKGSGVFLLPDEYVPAEHILHDLIRGFYKPKGKPYMLSYQATESDKNYGKQIQWEDPSLQEFKLIRMSPPTGEKDNRAKSDIAAARYNLEHKLPIGILHKVSKGVNRCLGLGIIIEETVEGIFIVRPVSMSNSINGKQRNIQQIEDLSHITETEKDAVIKSRVGQSRFKENLLQNDPQCKLCGLGIKELLIASHIKPWSRSDSKERLDFYNGFLFCPTHDALFDKGFISFRDDGSIMISDALDEKTMDILHIFQNSKIEVLDEHRKYLRWHRVNKLIKSTNPTKY
ncbi:HNH endonuclease [Neobacillus drentensis]|uniref:HNH endonuclease n=1 Tax=Neobacillus drentensis TaxID=220684 RepID=UPI0030008237